MSGQTATTNDKRLSHGWQVSTFILKIKAIIVLNTPEHSDE